MGDLKEVPSHLLGCVKELNGRLPSDLVSPEGWRASGTAMMITEQLKTTVTPTSHHDRCMAVGCVCTTEPLHLAGNGRLVPVVEDFGSS